jgi:hypothetical protein
METTSTLMKIKSANKILNIILKHMNYVSPIDTREFGILDEYNDEIVNHYTCIVKLLGAFQENPLFTPEFAKMFQKNKDNAKDLGIICNVKNDDGTILPVRWEIDPTFLVQNPSWDLRTILEFIDGDVGRFLNIHGYVHPQYTEVLEELGFEDPFLSDTTEIYTSYKWCNAALYDRCVDVQKYADVIYDNGGINRCIKNNRIIENLICNPDVSFSQFMNILIKSGYGGFWDNPFHIYGVCIPDLYVKKPNDLRNILTELFKQCDFEKIITNKEDATIAMSCLISMVSFNNWWDVSLDSEFGERVWGLIKKGWDILWLAYSPAINIDITDDSMKYFNVLKMITRLWNPAWFAPSYEDMMDAFESETITVMMVMMRETVVIWDHSCYDIYKKCILNKDMVCTKDIIPILKERACLYDRCMFVKKGYMKGDSGMIINKFVYNKMIIPMRRERAARVVRNVLSRVYEKRGVDITKYDRCVRIISSFITK